MPLDEKLDLDVPIVVFLLVLELVISNGLQSFLDRIVFLILKKPGQAQIEIGVAHL